MARRDIFGQIREWLAGSTLLQTLIENFMKDTMYLSKFMQFGADSHLKPKKEK